jgi:competence protein ComEA
MLRLKRMVAVAILSIAGAVMAAADPVNVNSADAETISAELKGVGITKAIAIVEYRKANGPFKNADDLVRVKGIGARTVEINRKNILVAAAKRNSK